VGTAARSTTTDSGKRTVLLVVTLLTSGSPAAVTGGHLYHRRMADAAAARGARVDIVSTGGLRNPLRGTRDVVLVDSLAASSVAPWVVAGGHTDRPLAAMLHQPPGGVDHGRIRTAWQRRLDEALYRRCDLLIAASRALGDALERDYALPASRICVIEPGSDPPTDTVAVPGLRRGRRIAMLCVANWLPNKGILELLDAVAGLPVDDATLHLAGRTDADPRYTALVQARLDACDLAGRVVVHGVLDRHGVAGLLAGADIFVLPSHAETYGTVFAEALNAGLPTVGLRSGNLTNLIDDGTEGCLIDPGDIDGLRDALRRLATDHGWREQLAEAARRRGATLNTWSDTADTFFDALSRLDRSRG
jgi:glycosyltransferase involved in cell wall biosynthesis